MDQPEKGIGPWHMHRFDNDRNAAMDRTLQWPCEGPLHQEMTNRGGGSPEHPLLKIHGSKNIYDTTSKTSLET